jgi:hypothetical protein
MFFISKKAQKISWPLFQLFLLVTRYKQPASCSPSRSRRAHRKIHLYPNDFYFPRCFHHQIQHSTFKNLTSTFLITYPGLTQEMLDYEIQVIREFVKAKHC